MCRASASSATTASLQAAGAHAAQVGGRRAFAQGHGDRGVRGAQAGQGARDEHRERGRVGAEREPAFETVLEAAELEAGGVDALEHRCGVAQQHGSRPGRPHPAGVALDSGPPAAASIAATWREMADWV